MKKLLLVAVVLNLGCTEMAPPGELTAREACKLGCMDKGAVETYVCNTGCDKKWKEGERIPKELR
jgi:hypothetical protein